MRASIAFRGEDQRPLVRAKVPIAVLGVPFVSGLAAGNAAELRFDLATALAAGPRLRFSYRPNDLVRPFSVAVKAGAGPFGSPAGAPFSISAEFSLLASDGSHYSPAFSLHLKPQFGDFAAKSSVSSAAVATIVGASGDAGMPAIGLRPLETAGLRPASTNGFLTSTATARSGVAALLSGTQLTANSLLPLWNYATLRFRWGLRVPTELRAAFSDDDWRMKKGNFSPQKLPLLVMNKISIEQLLPEDKSRRVPAGKDGHGKSGELGAQDETLEGFSLMRQQLEELKVETSNLRRMAEDLRVRAGLDVAIVSPSSDKESAETRGKAMSGLSAASKEVLRK